MKPYDQSGSSTDTAFWPIIDFSWSPERQLDMALAADRVDNGEQCISEALPELFEKRSVTSMAKLADVQMTYDSDRLVVDVEAMTDEGQDLVDGFMPKEDDYRVIDSGRIVIPAGAAADLLEALAVNGLTYERFDGPVTV